MPKIITERLKQNIEAYSTSPETAKGIWGGSVSLILSSKLNNRLAGKLFYLVGDNYSENLAYGIIKLMPGEKVRKNDLPKLSEQHGLTNEQIEKKWPNKQVLYSYKFKTLDIFPSPILVKVDPKTKIIENMGTNDDISEIFEESAETLREADPKELTRLYRKKAKSMHPDTGGDQGKFVRLTKAYEQLLQEKKRK